MNKKKMMFLLLLSSLAYSEQGIKNEDKSKIKGEVTFGIDASFGVDGAETLVRMFPPMIDVLRPYKFSDYEAIFKEDGSNTGTPGGGGTGPSEPMTYSPKYEGLNRDLELAVKYLSKNAELRKRVGVKIKEEYLGLGLGVDVSGKKITHTEFLGNNDIEKIKLSISSDNKYVNGHVDVYIKGESKEKIDIDQIDSEKELPNKVVDYSVKINPIPDKKYSISLDFDGRNKNIYYGPTFRYRNSGSYLDVSLILNNVRDNYDVSSELEKIKYTAPGYDKIEYFKKWTQKEEYRNPKELYTKEEYDSDKANLATAEVSGFKGTQRILGHYSGSLYGDSPFRLIPKTIFDEIHNNSNFTTMSSVIKVLEKNEAPGKVALLSAGVQNLGSEIGNKSAINELTNKVGKKIYDRLGISQDRKYSNIGIWSQIPKDFAYLLPGFLPEFDYSKIKIKELGADYLYNNNLANANMPESLALVPTGNYGIEDKWHYFDRDIKKYVVDEIYKEYKINKIVELANTSTGGLVLDGILGSIFGGGKINEVISYLPILQDVIKNPYEMKNIDMLRGFYFHQSEKERNVSVYEKELKANFADLDLKQNKTKHSTKLKLNFGHVDKDYNVAAGLILNDNTFVDAEKYGFNKKANHLGFNALYKKGLINFNTNLLLTMAKNNLFRKDNETRFVYKTVDLNTDTYFGLDIPVVKNFNIGLGVRHIGKFGWINPLVSKNNKGENIKWNNVAKRDEKNNPIGLDGNSIVVSETTEKVLVDKVAEIEKKLKRDIHQSDFIEKTESDPVNSMFEVYNIVSPRITTRYMPYKNFIFTSHLEIPISMRKNAPAGIRGIYTGEIKYLLDDSYADIIKSKVNPMKFKTNGYFETGLTMGSDIGYYLNYKAMADASVLRADIEGNDKNIDFSLSFNPLIVNFPIKPRLIFAKEGTETITKYGLEYSKDTEFSSIVGFKNVVKSSKNIVKDELIPNILSILKDRNTNEYNKMSKILPIVTFDEKLTYTSTPFIDIKKEEGDFKLSIKASSLKANGESSKEEQSNGQFKLISKDTIEPFAWTYIKKGGWLSKSEYLYFSNLEYQKQDKNIKEKYMLDYENYDLSFAASYVKKKGIDFNTKLGINYDSISLKGTGILETTINTKHEIVAVKTGVQYPKFNKNELVASADKITINESNSLQSLSNYAKDKKAADTTIYEYFNKFTWTNTNLTSEKANKATLASEIKTTTKNDESLLLESKKIVGNLDTYLGYNFNPIEKMIISTGVKYNLKVDYSSINKIILNDIALFGSRKILINNTLAPEFGIKYEMFKGLNTALKVNMPFKFENKDFKGIKFNINTGLEYSW